MSPEAQCCTSNLIPGCVKNARDLRSERRNLGGKHIADQIKIDAEIIVDQSIPHPGHRPPLDIGIPRTELGRNALGGFADDREASNNGALESWVKLELPDRDTGAHREQVVAFGDNVTKKFTRLE